MEELLLTVLMSNYNHGHYLKKRVTSLLAAMPASSELLIVDDASTDNSVEILESFQDPRLKLVKNEKNMGVNRSVNNMMKRVKGKYICFQAADDTILPDFFTKMLALAAKYPEAGICCSDCGLSFEEGWPDKKPDEIYTTHLLKGETEARFFPSPEIADVFRTTTFWIPGHASIVKTKSIERVGGINAQFGPHSDWFPLHAIALEEGVAYLPETLSIWFQTRKSYSHGFQQDLKRNKQIYRQFLIALSGKRKLRSLFRKSGLLHFYIRPIFFEVIWNPRYWDLTLPFAFKALKRKIFQGTNQK